MLFALTTVLDRSKNKTRNIPYVCS